MLLYTSLLDFAGPCARLSFWGHRPIKKSMRNDLPFREAALHPQSPLNLNAP